MGWYGLSEESRYPGIEQYSRTELLRTTTGRNFAQYKSGYEHGRDPEVGDKDLELK